VVLQHFFHVRGDAGLGVASLVHHTTTHRCVPHHFCSEPSRFEGVVFALVGFGAFGGHPVTERGKRVTTDGFDPLVCLCDHESVSEVPLEEGSVHPLFFTQNECFLFDWDTEVGSPPPVRHHQVGEIELVCIRR